MTEDINWLRWMVYLIVGLPALGWLVMTRSDALRLVFLLLVLLFVQDVFSARRIALGVSVGPGVIIGAGVLFALILQRGRLPSIGTAFFFWPLFLLAAMIGVMVGSSGTGLFQFNLRTFQELYVEAFMLFLVGALALQNDEQTTQVQFLHAAFLCPAVAAFHLFSLVSGWRPPGIVASAENMTDVFYGGIFLNPNTLAHYYVGAIPAALVLFLSAVHPFRRRLMLLPGVVLMGVSLVLTGCRAAPLFLIPFLPLVLLMTGISPRRIAAVVVGVAVVGSTAFGLMMLAFPAFLGATLGQWSLEGVESERLEVFGSYLTLLVQNPLGVGLDPLNIVIASQELGKALASAHNIYIDFALKMGPLGLAAFLGVIVPVVLANLRALRAARDPARKVLLAYYFAIVNAFLLSAMVEPLYDNGTKMNNYFWVFAGLSIVASRRILADLRTARLPASAATAPTSDARLSPRRV